MKQAINRKKKIERELRVQLQDYKKQLGSSNCTCGKGACRTVKKRKKPSKSKGTIHMSELNSMRKRIKDLEAANENLTVQLQEEQNLHKNEMPMKSCKKDGKTVSSGYRKSIYHCLMNQVPVEFTGSLILNIVHEMTGSGGF